MRVEQVTWSEQDGWQAPATIGDAQLVVVFGVRSAFEQRHFADAVAERRPMAPRVGCSCELHNQTMTVTTLSER